MPTATVVLLVLSGVLVLALLVVVALVARSLMRATSVMAELGERLAQAEARLDGLRDTLTTVSEEVVEVAATVRDHRRDLTDDHETQVGSSHG